MKIFYKDLENPSFFISNDDLIITENLVKNDDKPNRTMVIKAKDFNKNDMRISSEIDLSEVNAWEGWEMRNAEKEDLAYECGII